MGNNHYFIGEISKEMDRYLGIVREKGKVAPGIRVLKCEYEKQVPNTKNSLNFGPMKITEVMRHPMTMVQV